MSSVVISGDTSGAITVSAPAVAGTNTLTLQAGTATNSMNTLATAVASTSGTSIDFTGIPAWVKRVTVMLAGVSTSGTSLLLIQTGSGSITSSGYVSNAWSNNTSTATSTAGFILAGLNSATGAYSGHAILTKLSSTVVVQSSAIGSTVANNAHLSGGSVTIGGDLDRIRLTTVNGTDTFDAGSVNILYEG
jgi:hypothetical protein